MKAHRLTLIIDIAAKSLSCDSTRQGSMGRSNEVPVTANDLLRNRNRNRLIAAPASDPLLGREKGFVFRDKYIGRDGTTGEVAPGPGSHH